MYFLCQLFSIPLSKIFLYIILWPIILQKLLNIADYWKLFKPLRTEKKFYLLFHWLWVKMGLFMRRLTLSPNIHCSVCVFNLKAIVYLAIRSISLTWWVWINSFDSKCHKPLYPSELRSTSAFQRKTWEWECFTTSKAS